MDERRRVVIVPKTFLGYELDSTQDLYVNYLTPTVIGCIFYITHFACDLGVTYRHFHDENVVWASLTLFFVYLPVILCFVITISSWELWAEEVGCGPNNIKWFTLKFVQHLAFPIWSMWRYYLNLSLSQLDLSFSEHDFPHVSLHDFIQDFPQISFHFFYFFFYANLLPPLLDV